MLREEQIRFSYFPLYNKTWNIYILRWNKINVSLEILYDVFTKKKKLLVTKNNPKIYRGLYRVQFIVACIAYNLSWLVSHTIYRGLYCVQFIVACIAYNLSWLVSHTIYRGLYRIQFIVACIAYNLSWLVSRTIYRGLQRVHFIVACIAYNLSWLASRTIYRGLHRVQFIVACIAYNLSWLDVSRTIYAWQRSETSLNEMYETSLDLL